MLLSKKYTTKLDSHPFWCQTVGGHQLHAHAAPESCCRGAYLRKRGASLERARGWGGVVLRAVKTPLLLTVTSNKLATGRDHGFPLY